MRYLYAVDLITQHGRKPYKWKGRRWMPRRAMNRLRARAEKRGLNVLVRRFAITTYPTDTMVSEHFAWAEFASAKNGCPSCPHPEPVPGNLRGNARRLAMGLELLRDELGVPITLLSVYRSEAHNRHVGGAIHSQHKNAGAADLDVARILEAWSFKSGRQRTRDELITVIKRIGAFHGIGIYPNGGLHVDVRPGPRVFWNDWVGYR